MGLYNAKSTARQHIVSESKVQNPLCSKGPRWHPCDHPLQLLSTIRAVNLLVLKDKTLVSQWDGAFFAVETIIMPGSTFIADHVGAFPKTCDRVLAATTLLGNKVLVTINAIEHVFHSREPLATKLLRASSTHKTLCVVRPFFIGDSSRSDGILALHTVLGKLMLMAGDTVEFISFGEETGGANHLLALAASEAVLVPDGLLVLHILITCNNGLQASLAAGRLLQGGAFAAPHLVVLLQHEGLVHQRCVALEAAEAGVMPVAVLEMQLLGISPNGFSALCTGVCTELLKALDAAMAAFFLHILLPLQRVTAIVAVKAF